MNEKLVSLQILRGIAALLVVIGHATVFLGSAAGVELFFIISGFIMMYITQKGLDHYFIKRIIRIVPLYWIATVVFVLLINPSTFTFPYFLKSLFFLNDMPILSVGWTLNCEVRFYIIFWISSKINLKHRGIISIMSCALWCLINIKFFRNGFVPVLMPITFILGILAYYFYSYMKSKSLNIVHKIIFCILIVVSALFLHSNLADRLVWNISLGTWSIFRPIIYGIPAFVILISLMFIIKNDSNKLVKALSYVGDISYSLYLWHIVVQSTIVTFFEKVGYVITTPSTYRFMILTASVSLIVAHYSYKYLEKPISGYLRVKLLADKKKKATKAV